VAKATVRPIKLFDMLRSSSMKFIIIPKRIFKKINAFDLIVVAIIFLILGSLLWLRVSRKTEWISLRLVVANDEWWFEGSAPQWWYVEDLSVGQTAKNTFGETVAEITNVQSFDVGEYRRRAFVDLKVKGYYDTKRGIYVYNYQPLQIGKPLDLTFGKHNVRGLITYIENTPENFTEKTIEVYMPAVSLWVAQSYQEGVKMRDSQGRTLAEIVDVMINPTTAQEIIKVFPDTAEVKFGPSQFYDLWLLMKVQTFESEGVNYFVDRAAVKVGERIWFQFPETAVRQAEITRIIE
jgi:hypothetical protein